MEGLYILTSICFFVWLFADTVRWAHILQRSDYRFDSLVATLRQEGFQKIFFSSRAVVKTVLLLLFPVTIFFEQYLYPYQICIAAFYIASMTIILNDIRYKKLPHIVLTPRSLFLLTTVTFSSSLLYSFHVLEQFSWLLIIDALIPFTALFFTFTLSFPTEIYEDMLETQLRKVSRKRTIKKLTIFIVEPRRNMYGNEISFFLNRLAPTVYLGTIFSYFTFLRSLKALYHKEHTLIVISVSAITSVQLQKYFRAVTPDIVIFPTEKKEALDSQSIGLIAKSKVIVEQRSQTGRRISFLVGTARTFQSDAREYIVQGKDKRVSIRSKDASIMLSLPVSFPQKLSAHLSVLCAYELGIIKIK